MLYCSECERVIRLDDLTGFAEQSHRMMEINQIFSMCLMNFNWLNVFIVNFLPVNVHDSPSVSVKIQSHLKGVS
jgi:hypothetical protein